MRVYLKAFLEQAFRPGFAIQQTGAGTFRSKLLTGKSARVVVTMGMPALIYRWVYRAHSLKSLERNVLAFCGIAPIKETLIGSVDTIDDNRSWLEKMWQLGTQGR